MNQYGRRIQKHWQSHLPSQYAQITDPETFFAEQGETAATQIQALTDSLAGQDQPGENFMDKLGRINMAQTNAEDAVMREMLPPVEATTT